VETQYRFWQAVQARYADMLPSIEALARAEAAEVELPPHLRFVLVHVAVPQEPADDAEWELSYETEPPTWHFTCTFHGWEPIHVLAEC
jgi:hypothetical protein